MSRFIRLTDVWRACVRVAVDRDGLDAHLAARANDAQRDLAAVGDENLVKHRGRSEKQIPRFARDDERCYSGRLPCFFGGFLSRFVRSVSSASMRRGRVSRGSMMSST